MTLKDRHHKWGFSSIFVGAVFEWTIDSLFWTEGSKAQIWIFNMFWPLIWQSLLWQWQKYHAISLWMWWSVLAVEGAQGYLFYSETLSQRCIRSPHALALNIFVLAWKCKIGLLFDKVGTCSSFKCEFHFLHGFKRGMDRQWTRNVFFNSLTIFLIVGHT